MGSVGWKHGAGWGGSVALCGEDARGRVWSGHRCGTTEAIRAVSRTGPAHGMAKPCYQTPGLRTSVRAAVQVSGAELRAGHATTQSRGRRRRVDARPRCDGSREPSSDGNGGPRRGGEGYERGHMFWQVGRTRDDTILAQVWFLIGPASRPVSLARNDRDACPLRGCSTGVTKRDMRGIG